jgi:cysteine desulfurase
MTQSIGKTPVSFKGLNVDFAVASGHKFGALPGIGFLYAKTPYLFKPLFIGGGQEHNLRSGTQNYLGIFSLSIALSKKVENYSLNVNSHCWENGRVNFETFVKNIFPTAKIVGKKASRIPLVSFIAFNTFNAKVLQSYLNKNKVYVSTGSACSDKKSRLSGTLQHLGFESSYTKNTIRLSLEDLNVVEDYNRIMKLLVEFNKTITIL